MRNLVVSHALLGGRARQDHARLKQRAFEEYVVILEGLVDVSKGEFGHLKVIHGTEENIFILCS